MRYEVDGGTLVEPPTYLHVELGGGDSQVLAPVVPERSDVPVLSKREQEFAVVTLHHAGRPDVDSGVVLLPPLLGQSESAESALHDPQRVHPEVCAAP